MSGLRDYIRRKPRPLTVSEQLQRNRARNALAMHNIDRMLAPKDSLPHKRGKDMARQLEKMKWGRYPPSWNQLHAQVHKVERMLGYAMQETVEPMDLPWLRDAVDRLVDELRGIRVSLLAAEAGAVAYIEQTLEAAVNGRQDGTITYDEVRAAICSRIGSGFDEMATHMDDRVTEKTGRDTPGRVP